MSLSIDVKPSVAWHSYDLPAGTPCTLLLTDIARVLRPTTEVERFLLDVVTELAAAPPKSVNEDELEDLESDLQEAKREVAYLQGKSLAMVNAIKAADLASKSTGTLLERFMNMQAALADMAAEIRTNPTKWS